MARAGPKDSSSGCGKMYRMRISSEILLLEGVLIKGRSTPDGESGRGDKNDDQFKRFHFMDLSGMPYAANSIVTGFDNNPAACASPSNRRTASPPRSPY